MFKFLNNAKIKYTNCIDENVDFVIQDQLLDKEMWAKFIDVYKTKADFSDGGWRGEFWGKTMRGGCLTYQYSKNKELYQTLLYAVEELIKTQEEDGRISSYPKPIEFTGWDMWCRKYVLSGLLHFYDICEDEKFKLTLLEVMKKHADYILARVGNKEGQIAITETSCAWGNVNACSILEPMLNLYKISKEKRYLDFGGYIISTGGCKDGNIIELAKENVLKPYQYPVTKAYEMISLFEGVLIYYEITGKKEYLTIAENFIESVYESDITIVGGTGCTNELFDNSAYNQTLQKDNIMQETCVTVTWIRVLTRFLMLTGESKYADRIEHATYNLLYGTLNKNKLKQISVADKKYVHGLTFDSYSPLNNAIRGKAIGGFKKFDDGTHFGCCGCIASAGVAIMPLISTMLTDNGVVFNNYASGKVSNLTINGNKLSFVIDTEYPKNGNVKIKIETEKASKFSILLRVPSWCDNCKLSIGGEFRNVKSGYVEVDRLWQNGDVISLEMEMKLITHKLNGKVAYTYGALTLAGDEGKRIDVIPNDEMYRTIVKINGKDVLLSDYASCGKDWNQDLSKVEIYLKDDNWFVIPKEGVPKINVWFS